MLPRRNGCGMFGIVGIHGAPLFPLRDRVFEWRNLHGQRDRRFARFMAVVIHIDMSRIVRKNAARGGSPQVNLRHRLIRGHNCRLPKLLQRRRWLQLEDYRGTRLRGGDDHLTLNGIETNKVSHGLILIAPDQPRIFDAPRALLDPRDGAYDRLRGGLPSLVFELELCAATCDADGKRDELVILLRGVLAVVQHGKRADVRVELKIDHGGLHRR
mmetsp:Transcript_8998/g.22429  ORF Transcript_8998/g.22429 Transcript_8998/m.22429 type:complete len:214 (-) Transcript_8998:12-653(-)